MTWRSASPSVATRRRVSASRIDIARSAKPTVSMMVSCRRGSRGQSGACSLVPGHLASVSRRSIEGSGVFAMVKPVGDNALFVAVTTDPVDALSEGFESRLDDVREVLAPVLIDASAIVLG